MTDDDLVVRLRILAGHYKPGTLGAITCHAAASRIEVLASAMSAGTAATTKIGAGLQPASAAAKPDAQSPSSFKMGG
jgi:hypothetical protein